MRPTKEKNLPPEEDIQKYLKKIHKKEHIEFEFLSEQFFQSEFIYDNALLKTYFYNKFKIIPQEYIIMVKHDILDYFLDSPKYKIIKCICDETSINQIMFFDGENLFNLCFEFFDGNSCFNLGVSGKKLDYIKIKKEFEDFSVKKKELNTFDVGLVKTTQFGLDIGWFSISIPNVDIGLNYGEDFAKNHYPVIVDKLETIYKGIYLFCSTPGVGKTFLIKHLAATIKSRKFIYLSDSIISKGLDSPDLIDLLIENKNCVLIIEDAEKYIVSREEDANSLVSNLLNLTDGILSDLLGFSVILTHNMKNIGRVDKALKRASRLQYEYKFDKLSIEDSQKKIDSLKFDYKVKEPMTLAEIYHVFDKLGVSEEKEQKRMGF